MKDLDDLDREMEGQFGLISQMMVFGLHGIATAAGSEWDLMDENTIDIPVNKYNAYDVYGYCKEIRTNGYSVGVSKKLMQAIKKARMEAHLFLVKEANNPHTPIQRKIELVRLCSRT